MSNTLYFGYGTYLDDDESRNYVPNARKVTTGVAKNRKFVMCAFNGRSDRGYCHITDTVEALGSDVRGIIFEHDPKYFREYPGFERFFLTVYGDDGKMYECWSLRMIDPGVAMRPPNYYWKHIADGLSKCNFPGEYVRSIYETYESALPCPDAERPEPAPTAPVEAKV
jgi:hypothetical protein